MLFGRLLGHEQHEHLRDRLAVGGIEGDRIGEPDERALRLGEALDAPVRDGNALPEAGGAQLFARAQAADDGVARSALLASNSAPTASNSAAFDPAVTSSRMFEAGRIEAIWFIGADSGSGDANKRKPADGQVADGPPVRMLRIIRLQGVC